SRAVPVCVVSANWLSWAQVYTARQNVLQSHQVNPVVEVDPASKRQKQITVLWKDWSLVGTNAAASKVFCHSTGDCPSTQKPATYVAGFLVPLEKRVTVHLLHSLLIQPHQVLVGWSNLHLVLGGALVYGRFRKFPGR